MDEKFIKVRAAFFSILSNTFLIILKFIAGFTTGSISILSEALHSFSDLLASIIAFISVRISSEPADVKHQYGHGKFEDLSGVIEGILILLAALYIIYESINKIMSGHIELIESNLAIFVMAFSCLLNLIVSNYLFKVAKKTDSLALYADAQHLRTDIYTSLGVLIGLILIRFTGIFIIDPIVAIIVGIIIIKAGIDLCVAGGKNLLDTSLPEYEAFKINKIIKESISDKIVNVKNIKTRKAGNQRVLEFVLIVAKDLSVKEGHDYCDFIEKAIKEEIGNILITIHLEPCDGICENCGLKFENRCS